jgi:surfeit locus 1 family protein
MSIAGWAFKPALLPTLATLVLLPVLLWLASWQWQRAEQKQVLLDTFEQRLNQPAGVLSEIEILAQALYQPVKAQGRYDSQRQILLDNQVRQGQPGYLVYTALQLDGQQGAILVNRGWVAAGNDRSQQPALPLNAIETQIEGRLGQVPNPGILLPNPATQQWPKVVQHIDYAELSAELNYPLKPVVLLLDPAASEGFVRDWQPSFGGLQPQQHIGYAVQWLALAVTLLIIYIVMNVKRIPNNST